MSGKPTQESALGLDGIGDDDEETPLDLSSFEIEPKRKADAPPREEIHARAKEGGFADRAGDTSPLAQKTKTKKMKPANMPEGPMLRSRYYQTGRNAQFNKKVRPEDRDRFNALCEQHQWVGGQGLQYALDALEEKIAATDDEFWTSRNFRGVD